MPGPSANVGSVIYQGKGIGACEVTDFCSDLCHSELQLKYVPAAKKIYMNK